MSEKALKKEKKPTLTERMDKIEGKMDIVLDKFIQVMEKAEGEEESPPVKEAELDAAGNPVKYFKFVSANTELLQFTNKRSYRKPMGPHGDYTLEPPEVCSFGRDTDGPPGFFKTKDEKLAKRLREKREEMIAKKLQPAFSEVTDDEAFADF